ncbi:MAG: DUF4861 domain-containing protein [Bacteroidales bacterium]|nr:DUF4861 domain-containing protein [Bacteroidales bacterium]
MRKTIIGIAWALAVLACLSCSREARVMARHVPERADDFVFENNLIAGRIYGQALEGNPTSPGIDIWVKLPGKLVANEWYSHIGENGNEGYYHHDHGGKDCYKVAVSLGGGATSPLVNGKLMLPVTNWRSYEILEQSADKIVFVLNYPQWDCDSISVSLSKKITVVPDTYFLKCEDSYTFSGTDSLMIAAGIIRHAKMNTIEAEQFSDGLYAIWEQASDQHVEPEDGRIGVGIYVPGATLCGIAENEVHGLCGKKIASGETFTYWFGNCWSKGDIKSADAWFGKCNELKEIYK